MRTIFAGCVLVVFSFGVAVADDFFFSTTKIEKKDGKWMITGGKKAFGKKKDDAKDAKEMTYTVDSKVKVFKGKGMFNKEDKKFTVEAGDAIEAGFKDDAFKEVSAEKPVTLYLTTEGDKVTKVLLLQKGKKKKAE